MAGIPCIDRGKGEETERNERGIGRTLVILLSLLVVSSMMMVSEPIPLGDDPEQAMVKGIPHAPIRINNDGELIAMATAESWNGTGAILDPFMIENYDIDATGQSDGIFIGNTTLCVEISNCTITNATYNGIHLLSLGDNTTYVWNCTCKWNGDAGLWANFTLNLTIEKFKGIGNNGPGVRVGGGAKFVKIKQAELKQNAKEGLRVGWLSTDTRITSGGFDDNGEDGIRCDGDDRLDIDGARAERNGGHGIRCDGGDDIRIRGASCNDNTGCGISVSGASRPQVTTPVTTGNGGDGVRFGGCADGTCDDGLAHGNGGHGISCDGSSGMRIGRCEGHSNSKGGLHVANSNDARVEGGRFGDNPCGIRIESFFDVYVGNATTNRSSNASQAGILVYGTANCIIENHTSDGDANGICFTQSSNTCYVWNSTVSGCTGNGAVVNGSSFNIQFWDCDISDNYRNGAYVESCTGIRFISNTMSDNAMHAIHLNGANSCYLTQNMMYNCSVFLTGLNGDSHGIEVSNTVNMKPVYYYSGMMGILVPADAGEVILAACNNVVIERISATNGSVGLMLWNSMGTLVNDTDCSGNSQYGIYMCMECLNGFFRNITANDCGVGLCIDEDSDGNVVENGSFCRNSIHGIQMMQICNGNSLFNNNCSDNGINGIRDSGNNNALHDNRMYNNVAHGINLTAPSSSDRVWNNTLVGNNGATAAYDIAHKQAYDAGSNNRWNTSGVPHGYGNYWGDWTSPDAVPPGGDGIVDNPYALEGPEPDYYPLTTAPIPIPEPGIALLALAILGIFLLIRGRKS